MSFPHGNRTAWTALIPDGSFAFAERRTTMLKWALIFLVISLIAGALGFTGIAAGAARISKILFAIFFAIFLLILIFALLAGQALF